MSRLDDYIERHIDREPQLLHEIYRDTNLTNTHPHMCCGHAQGRLLKMFMRMIRPTRVLEIGTFTGYSALCIAEGLPEGGVLHTVEIDDEAETVICENFAKSDLRHRITLHIGDIADVLPRIEGDFDVVFIDANKRHYADYYNMVKPRVKKGGFIIADNTLWNGKLTDMQTNHDSQTAGIRRFNSLVASDADVEKVIVPIRDGITIIHKLS